jgi:hypothetical protein
MKKLLITIFIFPAIFFIMPSCNKKLEVLPQNSLTPDQIKTSSDVEAVLFGGYETLQNYGAFGEQFILVPDLLAADSQVNWVGTYPEYKDIEFKRAISTNYVAGTIWANAYKAIDIANTVIDKINIVDTADQATIQGEALFIRGTVYFELVGIYGKPYSDGNAATNLGVPLVLLPTYAYDSVKNKPARASVADIYKQIISDLTTAVSKLPSSNANFRADVYSAKAILSRVYLNMQDYVNAATQANDVINSGNFSLNPSYDKAFNNNANSSEDIFAIQQTTQSNAGTGNQGIVTFYAPQPLGRGDAQIDDGYFTFFDSLDFRGKFVTAGTSISGFDGNYPNKWSQFYKTIPVVRLAEMYLTRGEANLLSNGNIGSVAPIDDINIVRKRANAIAFTSAPTSADFVDERFRELGFEGDRVWTLKRLKLNVDGYNYDDGKLILPIPQTEIDVNKNLVQNDGY